jgi:hypothetical protein
MKVHARPHPQLTNQGGKILQHSSLTPIYVGNYWNTPAGQAARAKEDGFAQQFGKSPLFGVVKQYHAKSAEFGGSTVVGGDVKPGQVFTDKDIQNIVRKQMAAFPPSKAQRVYTVVLPPGAVIKHGTERSDRPDKKTGAVLGGYHGSFKGHDGKPVYFAAVTNATKHNAIPFTKSPSDNATIIETHEWAEAITDPDVADVKKRLGFYDNRNNAELGDETQAFLGRKLPHHHIDRSREFARQDGYAVQKLWSNRDDRFEIAPKARR